jgi:bile acid:Na+ symporter, BASS family
MRATFLVWFLVGTAGAFRIIPNTLSRFSSQYSLDVIRLKPTGYKCGPRRRSTVFSHKFVDKSTSLTATLSKLTSAFPLWVVGACILALKKPSTLVWVNNGQIIETMLAFVMIGMGMTLEKEDFQGVLIENWTAVPVGVLCQFGIMPVSAWIVGKKILLPIDPSLYLGLALVGCSPGGTASNLVSLIAGANVALSVLLTACSTLLAAIMTPLLVKFLVGGTELFVSGKTLCLATAKVVLGPVIMGMLVNSKFPKFSKKCSHFTPFLSVLLVAVICGGVMAKNVITFPTLGTSEQNIYLLLRILTAVVATHSIGFVLGYVMPKVIGGYNESTARTISIETGMQNSALAVVLAQSIGAPPLAALPGAISALTHSCLGSILATYWRVTNKGEIADDVKGEKS